VTDVNTYRNSFLGLGGYHARDPAVEDRLDGGDKQEGQDWGAVGYEHGGVVCFFLSHSLSLCPPR